MLARSIRRCPLRTTLSCKLVAQPILAAAARQIMTKALTIPINSRSTISEAYGYLS
jgi:hypothetical protein